MKAQIMKIANLSGLGVMAFTLLACDGAPLRPLGEASPQTPTAVVDSGESNKSDIDSHHGGVVDGSGGEVIRSTREEVMTVLGQWKKRTQLALFRLERVTTNFVDTPNLNNTMFKNPELRRLSEPVVKAMFTKNNSHGRDVFEVLDADDIEVVLMENSECHSKDGKRDASITGNEICFSVPRLMRLSPNGLVPAVVSLAAHELAHFYGFDEETSTGFQGLVLGVIDDLLMSSEEKIALASYFFDALQFVQYDLIDALSRLKELHESGNLGTELGQLAYFRLGSAIGRVRNDGLRYQDINLVALYHDTETTILGLASLLQSKLFLQMASEGFPDSEVGDGLDFQELVDFVDTTSRTIVDETTLSLASWIAGKNLTLNESWDLFINTTGNRFGYVSEEMNFDETRAFTEEFEF